MGGRGELGRGPRRDGRPGLPCSPPAELPLRAHCCSSLGDCRLDLSWETSPVAWTWSLKGEEGNRREEEGMLQPKSRPPGFGEV